MKNFTIIKNKDFMESLIFLNENNIVSINLPIFDNYDFICTFEDKVENFVITLIMMLYMHCLKMIISHFINII